MRKKIILALVFIVILAGVDAFAGRNFMWKITGIESNIYLLSFIHALPPGHYLSSEIVDDNESAYFSGENSIIALLRERGYTVEQM